MYRLFVLAAIAVRLAAQEAPTADFGTTVASSSGLQGEIHLLKPDSEALPNFNRSRPAGRIYTTSLQVWPRSWTSGFPGITDRFEWFAIDYSGRVWIERPGRYKFRLLSDDGSKLYVNGKLLIDNDGTHGAATVDGSAVFSRGAHQIRVQYFQGPRDQVALVLSVAGPDNDTWEVFDTNRFRPPADPAEWRAGTISNIKRGHGQ